MASYIKSFPQPFPSSIPTFQQKNHYNQQIRNLNTSLPLEQKRKVVFSKPIYYSQQRTFYDYVRNSFPYNKQNFMSPEVMLQGLIMSGGNQKPCGCGQSTQQNKSKTHWGKQQQQNYDEQESQSQQQSLNYSENEIDQQEIIQQIQKMEDQLNNMDSQAFEAQNMLNIRENLYEQLNNLRIQRQQVEQQIGIVQQQYEKVNENLKKMNKANLNRKNMIFRQIQNQSLNTTNSSAKELNQRLKRRIYQVRIFLQKMQNQNHKIEEALINTLQHKKYSVEYFYTYEKPIKLAHTYYDSYEQNRNYQNNINLNSNLNDYNNDFSYAKSNQYFDQMKKRLQYKQDQAWLRLRQQQELIVDRNRATVNRVNDMLLNSLNNYQKRYVDYGLGNNSNQPFYNYYDGM